MMAQGGNAVSSLKRFIDRIETQETEKKALSDDIRDIYTEAKLEGLDPKIMRIIIRRRKMEAAERFEQDALVDTYSAALGMLPPDDETESSD